MGVLNLKHGLVAAMLLLGAGLAQAQVSKSELKQAESYMKYEDYRKALPIYEKVLATNPEDPNANFQIGICYLSLGRGSEAYPHLIKARDELGPSLDPTINLLIARSQHAAGQFDEAIQSYEDYSAFLTEKKGDPDGIKAEIARAIKECQVGRTLAMNPVRAKIENIGPTVNTRFREYTPVITADNTVMYFTSRREGSTGGAVDDKNEYFEDIYQTQNKGGQWTMPANLGPPVNSNTHDAAIALSPDGSQLFVYKDDGEGDIYISNRKGLTWSKPKSLGSSINTRSYREPSVSITADGKTIYFSSNRPGGRGGLDIYKATRNAKGEWANVENLGPIVNTPEDEDAPFIHPDGVTLYYSSKGLETMGGFDIFRTQLENGTWSVPENIGYPINTPGDDIYFVLSADGKNGYYASEKKGGNGYTDIYRIGMDDQTGGDSATSKLVAGIAGSDSTAKLLSQGVGADDVKKVHASSRARFITPLILVKGVVSDHETHKPLGGKVIVVDNESGETVSESDANEATGEYLVVLPSGKNYGISVNAPDYLFSSENFYLPNNNEFKEFVKNIELKRAVSGAKMVLRNIFFDTDKSDLRKESNVELGKLLKLLQEQPNLKLEISGHTDNVGSAEHNQKLSEDRAAAVVNYLTKRGIAKSRLEGKGYGFSRPFGPNDTEEQRQLNRRTEFEIK